jgi:hypothetical protein
MATRIFRTTRRRRMLFALVPFALVAGVAFAISGSAIATTATCANPASLVGSAFEIDADDANLKVDTSGCIDWLADGPGSSFRTGVVAKNDAPTGGSDDSFGQGTAEDNPNPTIVTGSIPPNKSDLKAFGVFTEAAYLELFWSRVQNPSGTTNMDFELNKVLCDGTATKCANNGTSRNPVYVTPKRSVGDKLITYDLSQGGTNPTISIRTWIGAAGKVAAHWSDADVISGGSSPDALGSINTSLIPATETGGTSGGLTASLGSQDPFTFGETAISFEALFGTGACGSFGSAYLKSRSSDSFTAEIKDFVAPEPVRVSNCPSGLTTTATASATVGDPISDTAHLTVPVGAGGTITFHLYFNSATCAAASEVSTGLSPVSVDGPGDYNSGNYTNTQVGTYRWIAVYSGDASTDGSSTACGDAGETTTVNKLPSTISTAQRWYPQDVATIDHGGGSVVFTLFKNDNTCSDATKIVFGPTAAINVSGSAPFTAGTSNTTFSVLSVAVGGDTYYWKAAYTGDATHKDVTSSCQESTAFSSLSNGNSVTSP